MTEMVALADIPEPWSRDFMRQREARIKFRRGDGFTVQPRYEAADGRVVQVHFPRIMEASGEGGHSLYSGRVCWDLVDGGGDLPLYLCEDDLEWLEQAPTNTP